MDRSKLPRMEPGKVVPTKRPKFPRPSSPNTAGNGGNKGGIGAVIDKVKERRRKMEEALKL